MKRELSIKDELRAIQSGELTCSPEKLAACAAYCRKRLDMLRRSLESQSVPYFASTTIKFILPIHTTTIISTSWIPIAVMPVCSTPTAWHR